MNPIEDELIELIKDIDDRGYLKSRESTRIEFKEKFTLSNIANYFKTISSFANIKGAIAHIWVFETTKDRAQEKCIRYVNNYGWTLKEGADVPEMHHMPLASLNKQEAMNYRHAELLGINAHFLAYPKENYSDEYRVESLKKPPEKNG